MTDWQSKYSKLKLEMLGDGVLKLQFDNPAALNAIDRATHTEITNIWRDIDAAPEVRAVVVTGAGRAFSAGGDMNFQQDLLGDERGLTEGWARWLEINNVMMARLRHLPKPVIAAVHGVAVAGGLEIIASCDMAVAGENVKIGDGHLNYGFAPGSGEAAILTRVAGSHRTKRLLFTGELLPARRLESWGVISDVVPDDEVYATVERMTEAMAKKSAAGIAGLKRLITEGADAPLEVAIKMEADHLARYSLGPDVQEGVAAFVEKREPEFPQSVPTVLHQGAPMSFGMPALPN